MTSRCHAFYAEAIRGQRHIWGPLASLLLVALLVFVIGGGAVAQDWDCTVDTQGANDYPGQKDLTQKCDDLDGPVSGTFYTK